MDASAYDIYGPQDDLPPDLLPDEYPRRSRRMTEHREPFTPERDEPEAIYV